MLQIFLIPNKNIGTTRFFLVVVAFSKENGINICRVHEYLYRLPQYQRIADTITFNGGNLIIRSQHLRFQHLYYLISTLASFC
jgi:hypothetical protein